IQLATYKISEAAHAAGNLHDLFAAIHEIVGGLMPAKNFYIALYDPVAELLSFPYFVDEYDTDFPSKRMGKGLTEYVLRTGQTLRFLAVNAAAVQRYGYSEHEFLAMTVRDIRPASESVRFEETLHNDTGGTFTGFRHRRKDGTLIDVDIESQPITFAGRPARLVLARDVTARRQLEDQLRQAQKMEAVGQ